MGISAAVVAAGSIGAIALTTATRVGAYASASPNVVKVNAGAPRIARQSHSSPCTSCNGSAKSVCSRCSGRGARPRWTTPAAGNLIIGVPDPAFSNPSRPGVEISVLCSWRSGEAFLPSFSFTTCSDTERRAHIFHKDPFSLSSCLDKDSANVASSDVVLNLRACLIHITFKLKILSQIVSHTL